MRCWPIACDFSQGMKEKIWKVHIPLVKSDNGLWNYLGCLWMDMACAHMISDVCQQRTTSAKASMHQSCRVHIKYVNSTMVWVHQPDDIDYRVHASTKRHQLTVRRNSTSLHASLIVCGHRLSDIVRDLNTSRGWLLHQPRSDIIRQFLCALGNWL